MRRACSGSLIVHAFAITAVLMCRRAPEVVPAAPEISIIEVAVEPVAVDDHEGAGGGGGGEHVGMALPVMAKHAIKAPKPWDGVTISEDGDGIGLGTGTGTGLGTGTGTGIGFGAISPIKQLPAPPPPLISKQRPAKLLHPTRQTEVDEAELFVAVVTVDESGDVVGAHMTQSHPGSRGETASSMIWQFRYSPALDDDGTPVRSTFELRRALVSRMADDPKPAVTTASPALPGEAAPPNGGAVVIDPATRRSLERYGFDEAQLAVFAQRAATRESTIIAGEISQLEHHEAVMLPPEGTPEHDRIALRGKQALARGEVGVVILAGGMATRFGGVVKAAVPVAGTMSFLAAKVADVRHVAAGAPIYVMTSAATHDVIVEQVEREQLVGVECFPQHVSLRLTPEGELHLDDGRPSPYATGHGDVTFALRSRGVLSAFRARGGKTLYMSNVDNVAATLDPAVIGAHLASGAKITAEVVRKVAGDRGGAPARVDGRAQIVEAFRFPPSFDQDSLPLFNTNSFVFDAEAIDRDFELTFFRVEKQLEHATVVQFERLVGELTAFLPSHFLEVPRSRFLPVKDPEELEARRPEIEQLLRARHIIA
jgi:UTP--glucose-1-phosphate uridylyltransferase